MMGMSSKEKSRRYRERLKSDPEKHAERKKKKRESYHKNKILISNMKPQDKINARTIWKLRKQAERKRKKQTTNILAITPPSSPSILQDIVNLPEPAPSLQPIPTPSPSPAENLNLNNKNRGRKKIRRDRSKLYKENVRLLEENNKWKKKYEKYKKRVQRQKKSHEVQVQESENAKDNVKAVNQENDQDNYKDKYNTLTRSIKAIYKQTKSRKEKSLLKNIIGNVGTARKNIIIKESLGLHGRIRTKISIIKETELKKKVKDFFVRDDVSRNTAGKKETVSKGKEKVQKRFLMVSMKNLFKAFKQENPDLKCSYFYFTKNRPFYVIKPTVSGRETCLCKVHLNAEYKIKALRNKKVIQSFDLGTIIMETVCDNNNIKCMFNTCMQCHDRKLNINTDKLNDKIQWLEWTREEEVYSKQGKNLKSIKNVKKLKEDTVENLIKTFEKDLKTLKKHVFNIKTQYRNFRQSINDIQLNEAIILVDFSENYISKQTEEIQAYHFGGSREQVTLHTVITYVPDCEKKHQALSFCTVSACNIHQPAAIWAHLHPILTFLLTHYPAIKVIHFFSDGPFSQYRQKRNFYLACTKTFDYGFEGVSWSFFEAGHGKGPADGIGGYLKRAADCKVATGTDINDALEFYKTLQGTSKVQLFHIMKENIDAIEKDIPQNILPLLGTKEVHQVFTKERGQLKYRNLSCYCTRGFCNCLNPKVYYPTPAPKHDVRVNVETVYEETLIDDDSDDLPLSSLKEKDIEIKYTDLQRSRNKSIFKSVYGSSDDSEEENEINQPLPSTSGQNNELPALGDFLLVKVYGIKGKSYTYACVAQSDIEEDGEIKVSFLKYIKRGNLFKLNENDISYVAYEDIVKKLPNPVVQHRRGVVYYEFPCDIDVFEK